MKIANQKLPWIIIILIWLLAIHVLIADAQGVIDFSGFPEGTIIDDEYATYPVPFVVTADSGSGIGAPVIVDTSNPPPWDLDLGSPNDICDDGITNGSAPGVGDGGETTNCVSVGNILVVEQDSTDSDGDGLIDDRPNDAIGGVITFTFDVPVNAISTAFIDQEENEALTLYAYGATGNFMHSKSVDGLGDNSVQTVELGWNGISILVADFTGSGGLSHLAYVKTPPTSVTMQEVFVDDYEIPWHWLVVSGIFLGLAAVIMIRRES